MAERKNSEKATEGQSVAADVATTKRNIQMAFFASEEDRATVVLKKEPIALGQVIGQIFKVEEREGKLPGGEPTHSLVAIGRFEAVNYKSGEVIESFTAYLPKYFLQTCKSMLDRPGSAAIAFAVEIVLTYTGKSGIPVAYEVRNLARRVAEDPINRIKAELEAAGRNRLGKPIPLPAPQPGEVLAIPAPGEETVDA